MTYKLWSVCFISAVAFADLKIEDGSKATRREMVDGNYIPALGLGTFLGFDEKGQKQAAEREVENAVLWALQAGYRLIDTASAYHNERQVGAAVKESQIDRKNVFIVTKLGTNEKSDVVQSLRNSLERLGMDYVDLYLIHNPISFKSDHKTFDNIDYLDTWRGMEEAKNLGLTKSIGVSNFNFTQMERLLKNCQIQPAVLQIEVNLNLAQQKLLDFCSKHNILVMAYTPFGSLFNTDEVVGPAAAPPPRVDDPELVALADKYNKNVPQIVLRYLVQRGVIPIPKSTRKERIQQNIDVFDFQLTQEEMKSLGKFNKDYRVVWPSFWQDHPYYPFEKKDVPDKNPFEEITA